MTYDVIFVLLLRHKSWYSFVNLGRCTAPFPWCLSAHSSSQPGTTMWL